jgi:hypothetical protein
MSAGLASILRTDLVGEHLDRGRPDTIQRRARQQALREDVVEVVRTDPGRRRRVVTGRSDQRGSLAIRMKSPATRFAGVHVAEFASGCEPPCPSRSLAAVGHREPLRLLSRSKIDVGTVVDDLRELLEVLLALESVRRVLKDRPAPVFGGRVARAWLYRAYGDCRHCQHHEHARPLRVSRHRLLAPDLTQNIARHVMAVSRAGSCERRRRSVASPLIALGTQATHP